MEHVFWGIFFDFKLVQGLSVESAVEVFCFEYVYDHVFIYFLDQLDDIVDLIGGDHGVEQGHLFVAVSADGIHTGDPVMVLADISLHDLFRFAGCDL